MKGNWNCFNIYKDCSIPIANWKPQSFGSYKLFDPNFLILLRFPDGESLLVGQSSVRMAFNYGVRSNDGWRAEGRSDLVCWPNVTLLPLYSHRPPPPLPAGGMALVVHVNVNVEAAGGCKRNGSRFWIKFTTWPHSEWAQNLNISRSSRCATN